MQVDPQMQVYPQIRVDPQMRVFRPIYPHNTHIFVKNLHNTLIWTIKSAIIENIYLYHLVQYIFFLNKNINNIIYNYKWQINQLLQEWILDHFNIIKDTTIFGRLKMWVPSIITKKFCKLNFCQKCGEGLDLDNPNSPSPLYNTKNFSSKHRHVECLSRRNTLQCWRIVLRFQFGWVYRAYGAL